MSTLSQFTSPIKSIQRGSVTVNIAASSTTYTATATITAVNPAKTMLMDLGGSYPASTNYGPAAYRLELTNGTTVTGYAGHNSGGVGNWIINYQVVEFF